MYAKYPMVPCTPIWRTCKVMFVLRAEIENSQIVHELANIPVPENEEPEHKKDLRVRTRTRKTMKPKS